LILLADDPVCGEKFVFAIVASFAFPGCVDDQAEFLFERSGNESANGVLLMPTSA
jgi:hypothetical protein